MALSEDDKKRIQEEEEFRAKARIEAEAKASHNLGQDTAKQSRQGCVTWFIVILGIGLISLIGSGILNQATPKTAQETLEDELRNAEYGVTSSCESIVKRQLKAPATAKFPKEERDIVYTYNVIDRSAYYKGVVDSENSFGALIRNRFECSYEESTNDVRLEYLGE